MKDEGDKVCKRQWNIKRNNYMAPRMADAHVINTDIPCQALLKDQATNVCLVPKIKAHSDCHSSDESWAEMSLSTADVFVRIEKRRVCMYVYTRTINVYVCAQIVLQCDGMKYGNGKCDSISSRPTGHNYN